ncbi:MAG: hypothetical protein Q8N35_01655 [Methylococcaceae bacterium]|nr:hypothetical protein [Methylococcaceae bacterium]MDZ4155381.1 hypothetical protein [Methylococcales bacterium]MDP2392933.1 hypothetical protein [Methylococcaceae bacterium]MDP3018267.1 hypothetical protein [Methylococcaceae bacterium]MDP3391007.1 hypothetical protein [Methylococcaceae bacterium]
MFRYKQKHYVPVLDRLIFALTLSSAAILTTGCANQIKLAELSEKCDKNSSIEKLKSPAYQAKTYYKENYSESEDESDNDAHENCSVSVKQIGLSNNSEPYKTFREAIDTRQCFHDAVLAFHSWETEHSLYLLDIEKPKKNSVRPYQITSNPQGSTPRFIPSLFSSTNPLDKDAVSGTETYLKKTLNDDRSMVLTHILKVKSTAKSNKNSECFVYDAYANTEPNNNHPWCSNHKANDSKQSSNEKWTENGWQALDKLGNEIRAEINKKSQQNKMPTHIILLATGWNTREYESFLDFKKWMDELKKNFEINNEPFNPIYIGIASELEWANFSLLLSERTKERDADEIGFTWANYLLNSVLKPIAKETGIQLVGIGHSFGSRIIFGAHYTRHIYSGYSESMEDVPITIIGMQAAFPTGRFSSTRGGSDTRKWWRRGYQANPYLTANKGAATVVITTSNSDAATGSFLTTSGYWETGFIGGRGGLSELENYPEDYKTAIRKLEADENGKISNVPDINLVSLYDASNFVNCEIPPTTSGSHSDVYDEQMGNFLGQIIRASSNKQN